MTERSLTSNHFRTKYLTEIERFDKFKPLGVSEQIAKEYLITDEGDRLLNFLAQADPDSQKSEIRKRAINQIMSGLELPRIETINEPLVKIVPRGAPISPFFAKQSEFKEIHP